MQNSIENYANLHNNAYMKERTVNFTLLKKWAQGYDNPEAALSIGSGISNSMAGKLLRGSYGAPSKLYRQAIANFIGVNEDELFPSVIAQDSAA